MASKRGFITVPLITSLLKLKCSYSRISQSILQAYVSRMLPFPYAVCSHSRITHPVCFHSRVSQSISQACVSRMLPFCISQAYVSRMLPFPYPVCSHSRISPGPFQLRSFSPHWGSNKLYDYADYSTLVAVVTSPGERVCVTGAESLIAASTLWNFSGPQDLWVDLSIFMEWSWWSCVWVCGTGQWLPLGIIYSMFFVFCYFLSFFLPRVGCVGLESSDW